MEGGRLPPHEGVEGEHRNLGLVREPLPASQFRLEGCPPILPKARDEQLEARNGTASWLPAFGEVLQDLCQILFPGHGEEFPQPGFGVLLSDGRRAMRGEEPPIFPYQRRDPRF